MTRLGRPPIPRKVEDFEVYSRSVMPVMEARAEALMAELRKRETPKRWTRKEQNALAKRSLRLLATIQMLRAELKASSKDAERADKELARLKSANVLLAGASNARRAEIDRLEAILPEIWDDGAIACNVPDCYEPQAWLPVQDPDRKNEIARIGLCEKHRLAFTTNDSSLGKYLDAPDSRFRATRELEEEDNE